MNTNMLRPIFAQLANDGCNLKRLHLSHSRLDMTGCQELGKSLAQNRSLISLDLSFNVDAIYPKPLSFHKGFANRLHLEPILSALETNDTLQELNLRGIKLTVDDIKQLQKVLQINKSLSSIKLNSKDLSEELSLIVSEIEFSLSNNSLQQTDSQLAQARISSPGYSSN